MKASPDGYLARPAALTNARDGGRPLDGVGARSIEQGGYHDRHAAIKAGVPMLWNTTRPDRSLSFDDPQADRTDLEYRFSSPKPAPASSSRFLAWNRAVVHAAIAEPRSNSQTEEQITNLELVNRTACALARSIRANRRDVDRGFIEIASEPVFSVSDDSVAGESRARPRIA